jgi:hypothetical protein
MNSGKYLKLKQPYTWTRTIMIILERPSASCRRNAYSLPLLQTGEGIDEISARARAPAFPHR